LNIASRLVDAVGETALFCGATLSLPALFVAPLAARQPMRRPGCAPLVLARVRSHSAAAPSCSA